MELSNFDKKELKILEHLLQTSNNVSNIFDRLCTLEMSELKDSNIYTQALQELTRAINIENETYSSAQLSETECYKYIKLLSEKTKLPIFDIRPTTSINNYQHKSIKRVINILTSMMINHPEFHKNILNDSLTQQIMNLQIINQKEDLINGFINNIQIDSTLDYDINCIFLSILEDEINKQKNTIIKNQLIKTKYCIKTTNKELEPFLITTNLNIPKTIFVNSKIKTQLLHAGEKTYNFIRFSKLKSKANNEISKLLDIKDNEYTNSKTESNSIIICCYLRALFTLMTDEEINDFNLQFHNIIENPKYASKHLYDRISENIIISCFKGYKYDKTKTRILSIN